MTIPIIKPLHRPWLLAGLLSLAMPLTACAGKESTAAAPAMLESESRPGIRSVLDEIYVADKPDRFEQIDASDLVLRHFPLGTPRETIEKDFSRIASALTVESTVDTLIVRDNRGQAMRDPDARSVVMTFNFDQNSKLQSVEALHLKSQ